MCLINKVVGGEVVACSPSILMQDEMRFLLWKWIEGDAANLPWTPLWKFVLCKCSLFLTTTPGKFWVHVKAFRECLDSEDDRSEWSRSCPLRVTPQIWHVASAHTRPGVLGGPAFPHIWNMCPHLMFWQAGDWDVGLSQCQPCSPGRCDWFRNGHMTVTSVRCWRLLPGILGKRLFFLSLQWLMVLSIKFAVFHSANTLPLIPATAWWN